VAQNTVSDKKNQLFENLFHNPGILN